MDDKTFILELLLIILKTLNDSGEATDEKQRKVRDDINKELEKLNS